MRFCYDILRLNKKWNLMFHFLDVVHVEGVEPPRLAALDPKSSASTNFATRADSIIIVF